MTPESSPAQSAASVRSMPGTHVPVPTASQEPAPTFSQAQVPKASDKPVTPPHLPVAKAGQQAAPNLAVAPTLAAAPSVQQNPPSQAPSPVSDGPPAQGASGVLFEMPQAAVQTEEQIQEIMFEGSVFFTLRALIELQAKVYN